MGALCAVTCALPVARTSQPQNLQLQQFVIARPCSIPCVQAFFDNSGNIAGVVATFSSLHTETILAPDASVASVSAECVLPAPGFIKKLWILTNRRGG